MSGIILFDGYCNFCSGTVQFIIKRDPNKYFQFASLQSDIGQILLRKHDLESAIDSFVLIEDEKCNIKSTAALRVCKKLKGFWSLLYLFIWVPGSIRDYMYDVMAKHRYQWFGKMDHCMMPTPEIRKRFLD